jgi:hypothetical protein
MELGVRPAEMRKEHVGMGGTSLWAAPREPSKLPKKHFPANPSFC